jgi:hypothetical protein
VCKDGSKNPFWNDTFSFTPAGDSTLRIELWDSDVVNDDQIAEGSFNLMQVYNMPSMRSDNGSPPPTQSTSTSSPTASPQAGY